MHRRKSARLNGRNKTGDDTYQKGRKLCAIEGSESLTAAAPLLVSRGGLRPRGREPLLLLRGAD